MEAQVKVQGVSDLDIVRIVGKMVKAPLKNMEDALAALTQLDPEDLKSTLGV